MTIRRADANDLAPIWAILEPVIRSGETYTLDRDLDRDAALAYWFAPAHEVWVAGEDSRTLGTYFLKANQGGGGAHVANCGYMTASAAQGRGVARAMCAHSLDRARAHSFLAMQYNLVVSTNERAVRLWESFGFGRAGRLPGAFLHPGLGLVDAFVMYRSL